MAAGGEPAKPISLFYSYSHRDEDLRLKLQDHLAVLKWNGMIAEWNDRDIEAGAEWEKEIDRHLSSADIILLLISASFIASKYCWGVEVKKALERHARGEARVIPVILRPCRWQNTPFARLQATPKDAKPVTAWPDPDAAFDNVVSKIEDVVLELQRKHASLSVVDPPKPPQPKSREPWSATSQDRHGVWAEIEVPPATGKPVRQRMRWIAPGRFRMGSPEGEAGRYDHEGPQHEVQVSRGFWLFDTPCTQALWQAVMGDNPSRFRSLERPVEQVSWEEVQEFLRRIEERVPGLGLVLPTEAQWEYACRAGTRAATYAGDLEILGENNAPRLDAIAWYGGNSGVGFELDNGWDSSGWPAKQYPHERAGTRPVGLRVPNAWGLYDMLGNVWEWCADGTRPYGSESVTDPIGPTEASAIHMLRGGSWLSSAHFVRSAYRLHGFSGQSSVGFRCARVQS